MIANITGKKILFFSPAFFNYECIIAEKTREMGAYVDMYDVRAVTSAFYRAVLKISPSLFYWRSLRYYSDVIEKNKDKNYDYILIVKCDMTPASILVRLKEMYPNAKLCLYLWDSVENIPGIDSKFKFFDTLHSFDLKDCEKYQDLKFQPLFFCDQFRGTNSANDYKYDISFIGTIHSDRYAVIKQVQRLADYNKLKCYWFLYLQSKFIYYFYKMMKKEFRNTDKSMFRFEKKAATEIAEVVAASKVVLDIQHPKQTGLTMRTLEMVGMNKKLITTNESIKQYDFYNCKNIAVVDRDNVDIPETFFKEKYIPLLDDVYEKYSLRNWILGVLD